MRADYDSKGDTIQIELRSGIDQLDHDEGVQNGGVIVGFCDGQPVMIDVIGARGGVEDLLHAAAERYDLDAEALIAAAQAALAAPDRPVTLDVGIRSAA